MPVRAGPFFVSSLAVGRAPPVTSHVGMKGLYLERRFFRAVPVLLAWVAMLMVATVSHAAKVGITDLRTWSAPDSTRMVVDLTGAPTYRVKRENNPPRLVIEIKGGTPRTDRRQWGKVDQRIDGVSLEATAKGTRITVNLPHYSAFKHFALSPYGDKPHRIVLDVLGPKRERIGKPAPKAAKPRPVATVRPAVKRYSGRPFVVVIDAGHGGEDPGAIGRYYKTREKDVVLKIARYLKSELDRIPGIKAVLTRTGDYFISLGGRVRKADRARGDLFISIHADSSRNRRTRGTHVYTLAPRTSQDRRAVRVARMENASDLVGGVQAAARLPMIFDRNGAPNNVVESRVLSHLTLDRLSKLNGRGRKGRRSEARFWVLKGKRPSILVETGFLSNKQDEKALRSSTFQKQLAHQVAMAVKDYRDSRVTASTFVYVIKKGDTLSHIAKRYGVSVKQLMATNRLRRNAKLIVGKRLTIPARGRHEPEARTVALVTPKPALAAPAIPERSAGAIRTHRVKRGENPTRIARRYGIRLSDLLAANGLSTKARLSVGQVLKIPAPRSGDYRHVVTRGQTLSGLAKRYGVPLSELARVNDLSTRARLKRGQSLLIPGATVSPSSTHRSKSVQKSTSGAPRVHLVKRGETLSGLAKRYGVSLSELARINHLSTRARLDRGQRLTLPADAVVTAQTHRVKRGETLSGLAQRYGVSLSRLARANGLSTRAKLIKGQTLSIPADRAGRPRIHVIRNGESLSRIALRYDVSLSALRAANPIADADHLAVGQRLRIPD